MVTSGAPRRCGFTMLELVNSVFILGILSAVAVPKYAGSLRRFRVDATVRQLVADLELARRTALATGRMQTVGFDVAANEYRLVGMADPDRKTADTVTRLAAAGYATQLVSASFDGSAEMAFDHYGRPRAGTGQTPMNSGQIIVRSGSHQRSITINRTTGRASAS